MLLLLLIIRTALIVLERRRLDPLLRHGRGTCGAINNPVEFLVFGHRLASCNDCLVYNINR